MLLVFSHAAVLDVNRSVFKELAQVADVPVQMIVPTKWQGDLIQNLEFKSEKESKTQNFSVRPFPVLFSGKGSFFFYRSLFKEIRSLKPTHVFVDEEPWTVAAFQAFESFRSCPRSFFTKQNLYKVLPPPFNAIQNWIFKESTHAYSVADEVTDVLRKKGYQKEIRYLPHSYDPEIFKVLTGEENKAKRLDLGLPLDRKVVSYFGRLTEEKGIKNFLQATKGLESQCSVLVVGNGPLENMVREEKEKSKGHFVFLPAIPHHEVGSVLGLSDILVLPSRTTPHWKEQFGRILVEAMACGAAVVGSNSGEIPHLIKKTGGGLVFQEGDVVDLAEKIKTLLVSETSLSQYKNSGYQFVKKNLSHQAVAKYLASDLGF
jgi:glycosyltransferase involved in cell wall biosynthesis